MSLMSRLLRRGEFPAHLRGVAPLEGIASDVPSSLPYPCDCHGEHHVIGCPRRPPDPRRYETPVFRPRLVGSGKATGYDAATMTINGEPVAVVLARRAGMFLERPEMAVALTPSDVANGRCK